MENVAATYIKLSGGKWGIRARQRFEPGAIVTVKTKGGGGRKVTVTEEVFDEHFQPGVFLYEIKAEKSREREAKCKYAGTAECGGCPHCRFRGKDSSRGVAEGAEEMRAGKEIQSGASRDSGRECSGAPFSSSMGTSSSSSALSASPRELTKEEAARQMERAGSCKELFEWLLRSQARFGADKKDILLWFNMRMGKLKVIETDRFHNRQRRAYGGNR